MNFLFGRTPVYPLVYFRVAFGLLMLLEGIGAIVTGWVHHYYIEPTLHFCYIGLEWIKPLPGDGMIYIYLAQSVVAVFILLGWHYRLATVVFFLLFGYSFWCEKSHYLNHHYLVWLVSGLMIFLPAHRWLSVDARQKTEIASEHTSFWPLLVLRVQLVIVYFYAGIAKLQPDWLDGRPLRIWFQAKADYPLIGPLLATEPVIMFTAWGGMLFDLLIAWLLLYKPTRVAAFIAAVLFHVFNAVVFQVGVFPWFMILASVLFFEPEQIGKWFFRKKNLPATTGKMAVTAKKSNLKIIAVLVSAYLIFQILFPFRHFFIPGDVNWTEEGHRYSWRMMLRAKTGYISYRVHDQKTEKIHYENPSAYLTPDQVNELADHPDMIWQFAQFLKEEYRKKGIEKVKIFAQSGVSLNAHPYKPLVSDTVDLAAVKYTWGRKHWVTDRPE